MTPGHPETVVAVKVREAQPRHAAGRDTGQQHLALCTLAGVEQQPVAVPPQQIAVVVAIPGRHLARGPQYHQLPHRGLLRWPVAPIRFATWRRRTCSSRRRGAAAPTRTRRSCRCCWASRTARSAVSTSCSAAALAGDSASFRPAGARRPPAASAPRRTLAGGGGGTAAVADRRLARRARSPGPDRSRWHRRRHRTCRRAPSLHRRPVADLVVVHHRDADQPRVRRRGVAGARRGVHRRDVQQAALATGRVSRLPHRIRFWLSRPITPRSWLTAVSVLIALNASFGPLT